MKMTPVGHRVLLEMDKIEKTSKGGIIIAHEGGGKREQSGVEIGTVLALGPQAYKAFDDGAPWCKPGDRVKVVKFSGSNDDSLLQEKGIMYRIINDDDVLAILED